MPTDFDNGRDVDLAARRSRGRRRALSATGATARSATSRRRSAWPPATRPPVRRRRGRQQGRLHRLLLRPLERRPCSPLSDGRGAVRGRTASRRRRRTRAPRCSSTTTTTACSTCVAFGPRRHAPPAQPGQPLGRRQRRARCGAARERRRAARWPPATSTATATPTSSSRLAAGGAARPAQRRRQRNASVRVALAGRVSNRSGVGAKVEMRAGSLQAEARDLRGHARRRARGRRRSGSGARKAADAVRVIWPSGILQTEIRRTRRSPRALAVEELDRKPSSCPYLYAWNGAALRVRHRLHGRRRDGLPAWRPASATSPTRSSTCGSTTTQLRPRDGRYELRVTNELEEALFVDRLSLLAVAHPADVEVHPVRGHDGAAASRPALFAVRDPRPLAARARRPRPRRAGRRARDGPPLRRRLPRAAHPRLRRARTRSRSTSGRVPDARGAAADGLDRLRVLERQRGRAPGRRSPCTRRALEVEDADGRWVTAIEQVGIPVGRPQTVVVRPDRRSGKGPSRRVRIVTSMRIYWDQVRVGALADAAARAASRWRPRRARPARARLLRRGLARRPRALRLRLRARLAASRPGRRSPAATRATGDVRELLAQADDTFVISRPGDEIALSFDARALPPLPAGWTRTFLLHVGRVQQGDGHQLRDARRARARSRSTA